MNELLSNLNILYVKLHNMHYNVIGKDFLTVHVLLEQEYNIIHNLIDQVAELIKKEDMIPLGRMSDYLKEGKIKEIESKDYNSDFIYKELVNDYELIWNNVKNIRSKCKEENIIDFLNSLEETLKTKLWFFKASSK